MHQTVHFRSFGEAQSILSVNEEKGWLCLGCWLWIRISRYQFLPKTRPPVLAAPISGKPFTLYTRAQTTLWVLYSHKKTTREKKLLPATSVACWWVQSITALSRKRKPCSDVRRTKATSLSAFQHGLSGFESQPPEGTRYKSRFSQCPTGKMVHPHVTIWYQACTLLDCRWKKICMSQFDISLFELIISQLMAKL